MATITGCWATAGLLRLSLRCRFLPFLFQLLLSKTVPPLLLHFRHFEAEARLSFNLPFFARREHRAAPDVALDLLVGPAEIEEWFPAAWRIEIRLGVGERELLGNLELPRHHGHPTRHREPLSKKKAKEGGKGAFHRS